MLSGELTPQQISRKIRDPVNLDLPIASMVGGCMGICGTGIGSATAERSDAGCSVTKSSLREVAIILIFDPETGSVFLEELELDCAVGISGETGGTDGTDVGWVKSIEGKMLE